MMKTFRPFRFLPILLALIVVAIIPPPQHAGPQSSEKSATPASKTAPPPAPFRLDQLFESTKVALQPPNAAKKREWAGELLSLGYRQAAQQAAAGAPPTVGEEERFAGELIRRGQVDLAAPLVEANLRREPEKPEWLLLQLVLHQAGGAIDLELRDLRLLQSGGRRQAPETAALVDLLWRLYQLRSRGVIPGVDANPWNVSFPAPNANGGKPPPAEALKLPGDSVDLLGRWLAIYPLQGNLWALLGQILYSQDDFDRAKVCFERAKALRYTPPAVRQYLPELERANLKRTNDALAQAASGASPATPAADANTSGITIVESSMQAFAAVAGGALALGLLLGLQLRTWFARR